MTRALIKGKLLMGLGNIINKFVQIFYAYNNRVITKYLGGGNRIIQYPFIICGVANIQMEEPCNIGPGATIYTTGAKLIIKRHFLSGPNLTIITGDHKYIPSRWLDSITSLEKDPENDKDVIIEEDVWCGTNVTILKGVTIGRSSIIAAGSLVTKDVPPYSIVGGIPARVLKMKWNEETIKKHEHFINCTES